MQRYYGSRAHHGKNGNTTFVEKSTRGYDNLPEALTLNRKILEGSKIHTGKTTGVSGSHVVNFQMADQVKRIFGVIAAVGSRKYHKP